MTSPLGRVFAAVLFDLDGTLVSSIEAVERSWGRWFEEYGVPAEKRHVRHGVPARAQVDDLLADRSPAERDEASRRIDVIELADSGGVEVLPGAVAALDALVPTGRCAIVTSGGQALARSRLAVTGLPFPPALITADDVTRGKPAPEPYEAGAVALGVDVAECLVVEDARSGIASARAAGAAVLAVATNLPAAELDGDLVVPDLAAVRFEPTSTGVRLTLA